MQSILYSILIPCIGYILIKFDVECKSDDEKLGNFPSLAECANACRNIGNCHFFIYGKDSKKGRCFWEKTSGAGCLEGWENDYYGFYKLRGSKYSFCEYFVLFIYCQITFVFLKKAE